MSGVGSQAGGFNSPNIPVRNTGPKAAANNAAAIKTVGPQTAAPTKPSSQAAVAEPKEQIAEKVLDRQQENRQIHKQVTQQRAGSDSFQARTATGNSREAQQHGAKHAASLNKEKELQKAKRQEFINRVQNSKLTGAKARSTTDVSDPEAPQKEQVSAQAAQAQIESLDPDAREKKKLEAKLQKIFSEGGDKGKGFVAFVRREMDKGPLPESIAELVDGFLETLRGSALSASEMMIEGNEPLITLRGIVADDNVEEHVAMQDSLSRSVVTSAGERSDLMAVRNFNKLGERTSPPRPEHGIKANKIDQAVEFVSSINKGSAYMPWDSAVGQVA